MNDQLYAYFEDKFEKQLSAFQKKSCCWAVLWTSLPQALDCLPHSLIISMLHAYILRLDPYKFLSKYLSGRHQRLKIQNHYNDVTMSKIASQITSLTIVYSTVYSGPDQTKHQSSASLAFVWWIHRGPVNSPHKWPVTRKMFPFDDVIMDRSNWKLISKGVPKGYIIGPY